MDAGTSWDQLTDFLAAATFDQVVVPGYALLEKPAEVRLFAFSVYLRRTDGGYLALGQIDQGDQLEVSIVDRIEHDSSLVEDPEVVLTTVDLTSHLVGDVRDFRVTGAAGYLTSRSDPAAGRFAALALTNVPGGVLLFDPLASPGVRMTPALDPEAWLRYHGAWRFPFDVLRWPAAEVL